MDCRREFDAEELAVDKGGVAQAEADVNDDDADELWKYDVLLAVSEKAKDPRRGVVSVSEGSGVRHRDCMLP